MKICSSAPSNIALIKYMGKIEGLGNKPTNGSISYTLEHLRTHVELELNPRQNLKSNFESREESHLVSDQESNFALDLESGIELQISPHRETDKWEPLHRPDSYPLKISQTGQQKFLKHLQFLKSKWGLQEMFTVRSSNNFPSDCGLASSASSFAALTLCAAEMFQKIKPQTWGEDFLELSKLSRQGSGSSCRSFFSPWALWRNEGAEPVDLPAGLHHAVILLEKGIKSVSSSEAHRRVVTSPRFQGRIKRAEEKLEELISVIRKENWKWAYEIIWDEFWDMHELFHTSQPAFGYMTQECKEILSFMEKQWKKEGHGPWVTLDAGPNIHLLFQREDLKWAKTYLENFKNFTVLTSWGPH